MVVWGTSAVELDSAVEEARQAIRNLESLLADVRSGAINSADQRHLERCAKYGVNSRDLEDGGAVAKLSLDLKLWRARLRRSQFRGAVLSVFSGVWLTWLRRAAILILAVLAAGVVGLLVYLAAKFFFALLALVGLGLMALAIASIGVARFLGWIGAVFGAASIAVLALLLWVFFSKPPNPQRHCEDVHAELRAKTGAAEVLEDCVTVYYATPRAPIGLGDPTPDEGYSLVSNFGKQFGKTGDAALHWGRAEISVPRRATPASDEIPETDGQFDWVKDARTKAQMKRTRVTYLTIASKSMTSEGGAYFKDLNEAIGAAASADGASTGARGKVLLHVHGFKVSFRSALEATARLAYDLNQRNDVPELRDQSSLGLGQPFLFSWPNTESPIGYWTDRDENSTAAAPYLAEAMNGILARTDTAEINIVVHSMGNKVLVEALRDFSKARAAPRSRPIKIRIIHAAADVDNQHYDERVSEFELALERDGVPEVEKPRVNIYADANDWALWFSASIFANNKDRVGRQKNGDARNPPYRFGREPYSRRYSSIDATGFLSEFNHSSFSTKPAILADIACALEDRPMDDRPLKPINSATPAYWKMYSGAERPDGSQIAAACRVAPLPAFKPNCPRHIWWARSWVGPIYRLLFARAVAECESPGRANLCDNAPGESRPDWCACPVEIVVPKSPDPIPVRFKTGKAALYDLDDGDTSERGELSKLQKQFLDVASRYTVAKVRIRVMEYGSGDSPASAQLAEKRAETVRSQLEGHSSVEPEIEFARSDTSVGGKADYEIGAEVLIEYAGEKRQVCPSTD